MSACRHYWNRHGVLNIVLVLGRRKRERDRDKRASVFLQMPFSLSLVCGDQGGGGVFLASNHVLDKASS
jgi:hypothetical protein